MTDAAGAAQLGFDFAVPTGGPGDALAIRLLAEGFALDHRVHDARRSLSMPDGLALDAPWSLPSRLFRHPIAFIGGELRPNGRCTILVRHPLLVDHPFVRHVAARLHQQPGWEPKDEFDRDFGAEPRWWHAFDLMTAAHWRDLLATRQFTDDASIVAAVVVSLQSRGHEAPSAQQAREVLAAVGAAEAEDWSNAALLGRLLEPKHAPERHPRTRKVIRDLWRVTINGRGPAAAWALVHGIEDGWFTREGDSLVLSAKGLRRRGLDRETAA